MRTLLSNSFQATGGTQPGTSGPVYTGAIVLFLFVLSLFLTKGPVRAWIIAATIFCSVILGPEFHATNKLFPRLLPRIQQIQNGLDDPCHCRLHDPTVTPIGLNKIFSEEIDKVV